ncbi:MAG: hypothetical protein AAFV53_09885 [Myxococcota bacterium]
MRAIELIERSPMQAVVTTVRGGLAPGQVGGVLARAGVGKSAFLVHVALNSLVRGINVLHVSMSDTQAHVRSFYDEIFAEIARSSTDVTDDVSARVAMERHRVIHSCLGRSFTPDDLSRLLEMVSEVMDFRPQLVVIDGLSGDETPDVAAWSAVADKHALRMWMALRTHRTDGPSAEDVGAAFSTAIELTQDDRDVMLKVIRVAGASVDAPDTLRLDPVTMLVRPEDARDTTTSPPSPLPQHCTLHSGGAMGAEAYFGEVAERWGVKEVNFTFEGHNQKRATSRRVLTDRELEAGAVSLVYVSHRLHRHWEKTPLLRKVLQTLWHVVSHADQIFVIGVIQEDGTVHGGTGWSVELARRWHKPVWVFDQEKQKWFIWDGERWREGTPVIESTRIAGSGTRFLSDEGRQAIDDLFTRSFGEDPA